MTRCCTDRQENGRTRALSTVENARTHAHTHVRVYTPPGEIDVTSLLLHLPQAIDLLLERDVAHFLVGPALRLKGVAQCSIMKN